MKKFLFLIALFPTLISFGQMGVDGVNVFPQKTVSPTVTLNIRVNGATLLTPASGYVYEITLPTDSVKLQGEWTTTTGNFGTTGYGMWEQMNVKPSDKLKYYIETDTVTVGATAGDHAISATWRNLVHGVYYLRYYKQKFDTKADSVFYQDVKIIVNSSNAATQVNAGNDTTVWKWQEQNYTLNGVATTAPEQYFRLDGSASKGASSYAWTQVSGAPVTIDNASGAIAEVHGIALGTYQFKLTINGNNTLSETRTFRFEDMNTKWGAPCRTGTPHTFEILPSTGPTLDVTKGRTYAAWQRRNLRKYVKDTYGEDLMGGDILTFNGQGIDSVLTMEIGGMGGSEGCRVQLRTKTAAPIRMKGFGGYLHFNKNINNAEDTLAAVYFDLDGTYWRSAGTPYSFLIDNAAWAARDYQTTIVPPRTAPNLWNGTPVGLIANFIADATIKGVKGVGVGFVQFKHIGAPVGPAQFNRFILKNLAFEQNWWSSTKDEGMYWGDTDPEGFKGYNTYHVQPRLKNIAIRNNYFENTGWDGIQVANATSGVLIENNLVRNAAVRHWASQQAGIMFGGNNNGMVRGNVIKNVGGNGIEGFGHSDNYYLNNVIDSSREPNGVDGLGMYLKSQRTYPEYYPAQRPTIDGNVFSNWADKPIKIASAGGTMGTPVVSNNTFVSTLAPAALITSDFSYTSTGNRSIPSFKWAINAVAEKLNDPTTGMQITATINDGAPQVFNTVSDLNNALRVAAGGNLAPKIASISTTKNITFPANAVTLTGSATDADGTIATKSWSKVSGGAAVIGTINGYSVDITGLELGQYLFRLTVTDNDGGTTFGDVAVNVNSVDVPNPNTVNVDAGADQSVTLSTATLTGTASSVELTDVAYQWSQVSGPSFAVIVNASSPSTKVTNLTTGTYLFRLTAQDDAGGDAYDDVVVNVNLTGQVQYNRVYLPYIESRKFGPAPLVTVQQPQTMQAKKVATKTVVKKSNTSLKKATTNSKVGVKKK